MALATYTDLQTAVATWTHRADLTSQIPDFITLAEMRVARDLRISPLVAQATVTIAPGGTSVALPASTLEIVSVKITGGGEVKYVAPDTYDRAIINSNGVAVPLYYTLITSNIYVAPSWTAGGTLTLNYFKKETVLSGGSPTNWYITNAPDLLLYACLLEAAPYMKDTVDASMWKAYYENARDRLNDQYGVLDAHQRMMAFAAGKANALTPSI